MKILVTGGAGFIGSNFVSRILSGQYPPVSSVRILDKITYAGNQDISEEFSKSGVEFIAADICDETQVKIALKSIDCVVNFAAESHVDRSIKNPTPFVVTNVLGTQVLLKQALAQGVGVFVQVSTDEVYGSIQSGQFDEKSNLNPSSPYAASKAAGDLLALSFQKTFGLDVRVTRSVNNYGPYQHNEKLIPNFILRLLRNKKLPLYGDGLNMREWIYVEDNCDAIFSVIQKGVPGGIYNVGSGVERSNKEIAHLLVDLLHSKYDMIEYVEDRKGHDFRYALNSQFLFETTGFLPKVGFLEGIGKTIEWYKSSKDLHHSS